MTAQSGLEPALSAGQSVFGALLVALLLAGLHLAAPRIRRLPLVPESATGSFAGGLAVAYVFLHLLPEIAEGNEAVGEALSETLRPTPLVDLGIFLVALAGFTAFYGLERLAQGTGTGPAALEGRPAGGGQAWVYRTLGTSTALTVAASTAVSLALASTVYASTGSALRSALALLGPSVVQVVSGTLMSVVDASPPRRTLAIVTAVIAAVAVASRCCRSARSPASRSPSERRTPPRSARASRQPCSSCRRFR